MTTQLHINDRGELEPVSWDGEPLFCRETVREMTAQQLFDSVPFGQIRGQLALEDDDERL